MEEKQESDIKEKLVNILVAGHSITSREFYDALSEYHDNKPVDIRNLYGLADKLKDLTGELDVIVSEDPCLSESEDWFEQLSNNRNELEDRAGKLLDVLDELL